MLDNDTIIIVTNRDNGSVGYTIPDLGNLYRSFEAGETKEIPMIELKKLNSIPGGDYILKNCLQIRDNEQAVKEILNNVEPEYYYTEEDIKNLLLNESLDKLLDCLDFAPEGTINLVKKYAVDLKLNDLQKRKAILDKTGFNVTSAIMVNEETSEENPTEAKTRRVVTTPTSSTAATGRRTQPTSKYKVTSIQQ